MIKMKTDDGVLIIPPAEGIHLIASNQYTDLMIRCLASYFGQKKKTICVAVDEDDDVINNKEIAFVYFPAAESIDQWFEFKQKTPMNTEFTEMIGTNPEMFMSMETVREGIKGLLTDSGMYRFREILQHGTNINLCIDLLNYDIHSIVSNLHIDTEELSSEQKYMLAYNLFLYLNRNRCTIIYIDFKVTDDVSDWLQSKRAGNRLFLISNENVTTPASIYDSMIIPSISDHVSTISAGIEQTGLYSYLFHPIVRANMNYQTEKNIEFMSQFMDANTTFSIEFTPEYLF